VAARSVTRSGDAVRCVGVSMPDRCAAQCSQNGTDVPQCRQQAAVLENMMPKVIVFLSPAWSRDIDDGGLILTVKSRPDGDKTVTNRHTVSGDTSAS